MVNNGKNPFVPASPATTPATPATTTPAETTTPATTTPAETTTPATDSGFDMGAFMNALKNPTPEPVQGTVTFTPPPDESTASEPTANEPAQEGDTNAEQPAEQENTPETEGEPVPVPEENKSKIMDTIQGLIGKLNLSGSFGSILNDGLDSQLMKDLMNNMAKASSNKSNNNNNNNNNNNSKTLTILIFYENGANVIKNQEINVLPTPPFNIKIHNTPFTLSNDGTVQNNGTDSNIVLNDVSHDTIKIIMCMYNNDVYARYVSPTASTSGGRKTRNRHKKHNKNKSGVHKPHRERQRRTIKKHIKYKCNKKTYKIDIIIQLPE